MYCGSDNIMEAHFSSGVTKEKKLNPKAGAMEAQRVGFETIRYTWGFTTLKLCMR